jgi:hypothetical protein
MGWRLRRGFGTVSESFMLVAASAAKDENSSLAPCGRGLG